MILNFSLSTKKRCRLLGREDNMDMVYKNVSSWRIIGMRMFWVGIFFFLLTFSPLATAFPGVMFVLSIGLGTLGGLVYIIPEYWESMPGVKKNGTMFRSATSRGAWGWIAAVLLTAFYICLYWVPQMLTGAVHTVDWLAYLLSGKPASRWFLYGTLYTLSVMVMGVRMIIQNRHNRYQVIRSISVVFFQLVFAYLVPTFLKAMNQPDFYFTYYWPLKYDYLFPRSITKLFASGGVGYFMVFWSMAMSFIIMPILTFLVGKRWYCSWVCGCGGLAETLGDPYRHLSDKRLSAWKLERWMIYSILLLITIGSVVVWGNFFMLWKFLGGLSAGFTRWYGFFIGALFAGVVGVGFYPLLGSRVWCRFGCPLAAGMGLIQKYFSRFRITTNGGQCISCGNCSTYCEMGIDVRAYAQCGQNIVRASCVGCGVCAEVCPRGVLKLENGAVKRRVK